MRQGIEDIKKEVTDALAIVLPQIEGLEDFADIRDSEQGTKQDISSLTGVRTIRRDKLNDVMAKALILEEAIRVLDADGHPALPKFPVKLSSYEDMAGQKRSIGIAFDEFVVEEEAVSAEVTFGSEVD